MDQWIEQLRRILGRWPDEAGAYFRTAWGLSQDFASRAALLYAALHYAGLAPRITSGYRNPEHQAALRAAWDRGQRAGLRVRPAAVSYHSSRQAIDMPSRDDALAARIARALGLRAGIDFSTPDPGHYDDGGGV